MDESTHTHNPPARLRVSFARRGSEAVASSFITTPSQRITSANADEENREATHDQSHLGGGSPVILIDPKKINDFWRFRAIFFGMLLMINTSTQGLFSIFGLYMQRTHGYDIPTMVDIITCGTTFGLFVFPFGALYEFIGPKIVIALATAITALSHLLFALTFGGHIDASKARFCIYFALMNWGCYAFEVVALPAVLGFTPRNRAQPTGLMNTFTGLGPSVFTTIFRAFFNDRYDHLMYFLMAIVLGFGATAVVFLDNAPYVITRVEEKHISLRERLSRQLIRNRFMSQLLPKRRLQILAGIMVLLNIYLTVQSIAVAYTIDTMTKSRYIGIAVGAIVIVLSLLVIVIPLHCLDGPTAQDQLVLERAREREQELMERRKKRHLRGGNTGETEPTTLEISHEPFGRDADGESPESTSSNILQQEENQDKGNMINHNRNVLRSLTAVEVVEERMTAKSEVEYQPVDPNVNLIETDEVLPVEEIGQSDSANALQQWLYNASVVRSTVDPEALSAHGGNAPEAAELEVITREVSTYDHPHVETITVCNEVFVTPVYETTFLESLTYIDLWLLFYTTFVIWGIGLTMTTTWNISIMVGSRFEGLDTKTTTLFATIASVSTAFGRVSVGSYEMMLPFLGERLGVSLPATVAYPLPSILMTLALIFYLSFPGNYSLLVVYLLAPIAYGFSTSMTIYVIGIIFKRDIGMHYGFCFLGAALGMAALYRGLLFGVYDKHKLVVPPGFLPPTLQGVCRGNVCMRTTLIVYLVLAVTSIGSSVLLHYRYWRLVHGKLKYRRVITHLVKKGLRRGRPQKVRPSQQQQEEEKEKEERDIDRNENA
ncbi:uncharacterized protein TM35_000092540 [Trypanosoma theileri]|uniref:Nodulin-like domain-containing protein n=1 Tax=Trypanosoma theileri TaxID=67003 RepID=A0A1X0NZT1_9TRYP|nr:uncharacterized protein TM35_000092540 [Trypanosoma theileri]ORC90204.1 hypothetical protein TM35_000092540 [Trypanosoma theileri]